MIAKIAGQNVTRFEMRTRWDAETEAGEKWEGLDATRNGTRWRQVEAEPSRRPLPRLQHLWFLAAPIVFLLLFPSFLLFYSIPIHSPFHRFSFSPYPQSLKLIWDVVIVFIVRKSYKDTCPLTRALSHSKIHQLRLNGRKSFDEKRLCFGCKAIQSCQNNCRKYCTVTSVSAAYPLSERVRLLVQRPQKCQFERLRISSTHRQPLNPQDQPQWWPLFQWALPGRGFLGWWIPASPESTCCGNLEAALNGFNNDPRIEFLRQPS